MPKKGRGAHSRFISVGRIVAPWGVKGELKVEVLTDFPERFAPKRQVYVDGSPLIIESSRPHKKNLVLKFATIDSIEAAEKLRGRLLEVPYSEVYALPEGEYYRFELMGLEVCTTAGEPLGRIDHILATGSNDVFVVRADGKEVLIPAIEDVVKSIDIEKGRVVIELIDGLLER